MKSKVYCDTCQKQVDYDVIKKELKKYKGCEVNHIDKIGICKECNNEVFVESLEADNLNRLYKKYRKLNNMVTPEDIIVFREKYNVSQRELVSILGWGKMTINRYERGSLANKSHNDMLRIIINDEKVFFDKVKEAYENARISEKKYNGITKNRQEKVLNSFKDFLEIQLSHDEDIYNGYRRFDIDKTENLISYLAHKVDGIYKTQLNKLLFYIDFAYFKNYLRSITGLRYIRYTYGPVVEGHMYNDLVFTLKEKYYYEEAEYNEKTITYIKSLENYDLSSFSENEVNVINTVIDHLKTLNAKKISELSHKEKAWLQNRDGDLISYDDAEKLLLF